MDRSGEVSIRQDIFASVEALFKQKIVDFQEICYGRLNLKWIASLGDGTAVFIKQYHPDRYKGKMSHTVRALEIQRRVYYRGVKCPKIYSFHDEVIMKTAHGHWFAIFDLISGVIVPYGETNLQQVHALGQELGKLHQALREIPPRALHWIPDRGELETNWTKQLHAANEKPPSARVMSMLHKQMEILRQLDFSIFDACRKGWAHWDMHLHNVLFDGQELTAILDFDRMRYVFPDLDIARAALSSCYREQQGIDTEKVNQFLTGYREYIKDYTAKEFVRALRLLWAKESKWWVKGDIEECSVVPQRFAREIEWLQDHWHDLERILF